MKGDQVEGSIRDSEIKFQCRLLLAYLQHLPKELHEILMEPVAEIIKLENKRLNILKEKNLGKNKTSTKSTTSSSRP